MASPAHDADETMRAARAVKRNAVANRSNIGKRSAGIYRRHRRASFTRVAVIVAAIIVAASVTGGIIGGLGFWGLMATVLLAALAAVIFTMWPAVKIPKQADLAQGDLASLVGNVELWLEQQSSGLPAEALPVLGRIGAQLDALADQLAMLDPSQPVAQDVRTLVGKHLPDLISDYKRIPAHLRRVEAHGSTPDAQLVKSLGLISEEIADVTRQLAAGEIEKLAIRGRYLENRYASGSALPAPDMTLPEINDFGGGVQDLQAMPTAKSGL